MKPSWLLAFILTIPCLAHAAIPEQINICDDAAEWPPFTYLERVDGNKTAKIIGFSVDYLKLILDKHQLRFKLSLVPWKRCLVDVKNSQSGGNDFAMILNAARSPDRERDYLISKPYYELTGIYFYSKNRPEPKIESMADLKKYPSCGQVGYTYQNFGLQENEIKARSVGLVAAMKIMEDGGCDIVLSQLEVVAGERAIGKSDFLNMPGLGYKKVPGMPGTAFHMLVGRNLSYSGELLSLLNQGLEESKSSKAVEALRKKYLQ